MNDGSKLKARWKNQDELISRILECIGSGDDSWPSLITDLDHVQEVENGRDLRGISLNGRNLTDFVFKSIDMRYADLSKTKLNGAVFESIDLRHSDLTGSDLLNADLQTADLKKAVLERIKVDEDTDWGQHFLRQMRKRRGSMTRRSYFATELGRYFNFKGKIRSEVEARTEEDFRDVQQVYRYLRRAYQDINTTMADYFQYRESSCELELRPKASPSSWIGRFWHITTCDGTSPSRLFIVIMCLIIGFALIYAVCPGGVVRTSSRTDVINAVYLDGFGEALYFSIVTFTSLGFGDFHPDHDSVTGRWLKFVCGSEALIGVISLALAIALFLKFMRKD